MGNKDQKTEYQSPDSGSLHFPSLPDSKPENAFNELNELIGSNYEILSVLGEGASGIVYKVKTSFGDVEALKIASLKLFGEEKSRENFIHELKVARNLRHEHLVPIRNVEVIPDNGQVFFTMTFMKGGDLNKKLEWVVKNGDRLQPKKVLGWMYQISLALSYIHQKGLVHQDIKPANILLDEHERAHIGDFGLAFKYLPHSIMQKMSRTSAAGGTSYFMSPEQQQAVFFGKQAEISAASDICSFGLTLYTLLSGRMITGRPAPMHTFIQDSQIATMVDHFLDRCWADNPHDRFQNGTELHTALKTILDSYQGDTCQQDTPHHVQKPKTNKFLYSGIAAVVILLTITCIALFVKLSSTDAVTNQPVEPPALIAEEGPEHPKKTITSNSNNQTNRATIQASTQKTLKNGDASNRSRKTMQHELAPGVSLTLKWIPAGTFKMGSPRSSKRRNEQEHTVIISRGFWIMDTELTQDQWAAIMKDNPSHSIGANYPVENVSWNDVKTFLKQMRNSKFRLPTEAEWEYACQAERNAESIKNTNQFAWTIQDSGGTAHPVGKKQSNSRGLYDLFGNVAEWVEDSFSTYPASTVRDPVVTQGSKKVLRGGNWRSLARDCRPTSREWASPDHRSSQIGFRLVREK